MTSTGAAQRLGRGSAPDAVAVMRPLVVVEAHELLEAPIERSAAGEVVTPKDHAPVLGEDGLLQPLDEAVRPRVPGLDPGVANAERRAGLLEAGLELAPAVGQHPLDRPPRAPEERGDDLAQEGRGRLVRQRRQDPGHGRTRWPRRRR